MKKYLRVYKTLISNSFAGDVIYRGNFLNNILASVSWSLLALLAVYLVVYRFPDFGGWSWNEALLVVGTWILIHNLSLGLFLRGLTKLPDLVLTGELDGLLSKPVDGQLFISLFSPIFGNFLTALVGLFVCLYALRFSVPFAINSILLYFLTVIAATSIYYSFWSSTTVLSFYFHGIDNIIDLFPNYFVIARYPQDTYRGLGSAVFFSLLPAVVLTTVPARILLGTVSIGNVVWFLTVGVASLVFSRWVWQRAFRNYSSAGG